MDSVYSSTKVHDRIRTEMPFHYVAPPKLLVDIKCSAAEAISDITKPLQGNRISGIK